MPFLGGEGAAEAATATVTTAVPLPSASATNAFFRSARARRRRHTVRRRQNPAPTTTTSSPPGPRRTRCRESVRSPTRCAGGAGTRAGHARCRRCGDADRRVPDHTGRLCRHSARRLRRRSGTRTRGHSRESARGFPLAAIASAWPLARFRPRATIKRWIASSVSARISTRERPSTTTGTDRHTQRRSSTTCEPAPRRRYEQVARPGLRHRPDRDSPGRRRRRGLGGGPRSGVGRVRPAQSDLLGVTNIRWITAAAETVELDGAFDLVAIGNAFHRLDRDAVAGRLPRTSPTRLPGPALERDSMERRSTVATCDARHPRTLDGHCRTS